MKDRSTGGSGSRSGIPPPTTRRTVGGTSRRAATDTTSVASSRRPSSAGLSAPTAPRTGIKRKERDFDNEDAPTAHRDEPSESADETKIDVFVRCRGRNEQEVRENSGIVVTTDGVSGKTVELSAGPDALSKKSYAFDGAFSPMADQQVIFEHVASPVIDEVSQEYRYLMVQRKLGLE